MDLLQSDCMMASCIYKELQSRVTGELHLLQSDTGFLVVGDNNDSAGVWSIDTNQLLLEDENLGNVFSDNHNHLFVASYPENQLCLQYRNLIGDITHGINLNDVDLDLNLGTAVRLFSVSTLQGLTLWISNTNTSQYHALKYIPHAVGVTKLPEVIGMGNAVWTRVRVTTPFTELNDIVEDPVDVVKDPVDVVKDPVDVVEDPVDVVEDPVDVVEDPVDVVKDPVDVVEDVVEDPVDVVKDPVDVVEDPVDVVEEPDAEQ